MTRKTPKARTPLKQTLTLSEATDLIARTKVAAKEGNLLGVIQPNGKPLGECTREDLDQFGQAMQELARLVS
jgi:hypothetical protein